VAGRLAPSFTPPTAGPQRALTAAASHLGRAGTEAARIEADVASAEGTPPFFVDGPRHKANDDTETRLTAIETAGVARDVDRESLCAASPVAPTTGRAILRR
jgi:hypothetical protein